MSSRRCSTSTPLAQSRLHLSSRSSAQQNTGARDKRVRAAFLERQIARHLVQQQALRCDCAAACAGFCNCHFASSLALLSQ